MNSQLISLGCAGCASQGKAMLTCATLHNIGTGGSVSGSPVAQVADGELGSALVGLTMDHSIKFTYTKFYERN